VIAPAVALAYTPGTMKVTSVTVSRTYRIAQFESKKCEITVELDETEQSAEGFAQARETLAKALAYFVSGVE
jgi:hypothetical protein